MTRAPLLLEAQRFLSAGNSIIPCSLPDKRPVGYLLPKVDGKASWTPFQQKPAGAAQVERWFSDHRVNAIAILTGAVSGGREMIDFDAEADTRFSLWCQQVEERCPGLVARLAVEKTLNSGIHVHYRCETVAGNTPLARRPHPDDPQKSDILIETRGRGGYAAVAPTAGYTIVQGDIANPPTITPAERDSLLEEARSFNRWAPPEQIGRSAGARTDRAGQSRPGDEYNERATNEDVLALLEAEGWRVSRRFTDSYRLTRPGKDIADGPSATLGYVAPGVLYIFSSNAPHPFEPGHGYSPFSVLGITRYGGDFIAAARDLAEQGYGQGTPPPPHRLRPVPPNETPPQVAEGLDDGDELPENVVELQSMVRQWKGRALRAEGLLRESVARETELIERETADRLLWRRKDKTPGEKLIIKALTELYHDRKDDPDTRFTDEGAVIIPFYEAEKLVGISPDASYRAVKGLDEAEIRRAAAEERERQFAYAPERKQVEVDTPSGRKAKKWTGATAFKMPGTTYAETIRYFAGVAPVRVDKDGQQYSGRSKWGGRRCDDCGGHRFSTRVTRELECLGCGKTHTVTSDPTTHESVVTLPEWAAALLTEAGHQKRQAAEATPSATCGGSEAAAAAPAAKPTPPQKCGTRYSYSAFCGGVP